jgi:hypothetical protein
LFLTGRFASSAADLVGAEPGRPAGYQIGTDGSLTQVTTAPVAAGSSGIAAK